MKSVRIGDHDLDQTGPFTWALRDAASPHTAFLSEPLVEGLARDGLRNGGVTKQIAAVTRLPNTHRVVTTPDTHVGAGSPIGTVYASPSTLSLPIVGVDISCGMAVVATNLRRSDLASRDLRLDIHGSLHREIPMGTGLSRDNGDVVHDFRTLVAQGTAGLREGILNKLQLGSHSFEFEQNLSSFPTLWDAIPNVAIQRGEATLGSLGGGNHFIEMQSVEVLDPDTSKRWGLFPDQIVIMIHSGSRAFGSKVADLYDTRSRSLFNRRKVLEGAIHTFCRTLFIERSRAERRRIMMEEFVPSLNLASGEFVVRYTLPSGFEESAGSHAVAPEIALEDGRVTYLWRRPALFSQEELEFFDPSYLVDDLPFAHRPLDGAQRSGMAGEVAEGYWVGVQAAQNYAVLSRTIMLHRAVQVLEQYFDPERVAARHLYDISHNNVQIESVSGTPMYVHRKGATRAFPAGHPALDGTAWLDTGHPVIVPGSMGAFSYIMKAVPTAKASLFSVNHGAGRALSRRAAIATLDRTEQQAILTALDVVAPDATLDEMPSAYKDIDEVVRVCVEGGLTKVVARCHPMLNAKGDPDDKDD